MAAVETGESRSHARAGKKHKKKRRLGVRVDMTPMVDVAFLLLTFFMLTTYFSKPQTMELNLPPDKETTVEVAESNLLTLRMDSKGDVYWNMGTEPAKRNKLEEMRPILAERNRNNPKLITLIKVDREGTYTNMVDIMDELNLANITRFSLAPMTDADKKIIEKAKA